MTRLDDMEKTLAAAQGLEDMGAALEGLSGEVLNLLRGKVTPDQAIALLAVTLGELVAFNVSDPHEVAELFYRTHHVVAHQVGTVPERQPS